MAKTLLDQLADKIAVGDDCWEWTGAKASNGYGNVRVDGRNRSPHRVLYELLTGPIPDGLQLDHLCRNRACVNPAHLEAVTPQVNMLRGNTEAAKNAAKTHCPYGHPYDEANTTYSPKGRFCRRCNALKLRRLRASRR